MSTHAHGSRIMRVKMLIHSVVWIAVFITMGTWLTSYMLWTLQDPLTKTDKPLPRQDVVPLNADTSKPKPKPDHRGDSSLLSEPVLPGHFHHIGRSYELDKSSFCIDCHGWLPHARNKDKRSFLNMHTIFTDCMVCHVQLEKDTPPSDFAWRRIKDGTLHDSVSTSTTSWGDYGYKIMPVTRGSYGIPQPWRLEKEEALAVEYDSQKTEMDVMTKTSSIKRIHQRCPEKPLHCKACHTSENSILPFAKLGFDPERRAFLSNVEVVEILETNKVFHLPELLDPNSRSRDKTDGGAPAQKSPSTLDKPSMEEGVDND